jgi:hypothetical protein
MTRKQLLWLGGALTVTVLASAVGAHWYRSSSLGIDARSTLAAPPSPSAPLGPKAIRFAPQTVEFGEEPVFSGDRLRFDVAVENTSRAPVQVTEFPRSCGCMTFGEAGDLRLPATLQPGEKLPLKVEIATDGKTGFQTMQLQARGKTASGEPIAPASLMIQGRILTSILPLPEELWIDVHQDERDAPIARTVLLTDQWPGDGLAIDTIASTAGPRMRFDLAPADGPVLVRGLDVRKRHLLTINYTVPPKANVFDETITITPTHVPAKPAKVRLRGRVLPNFEFKLDQVLVYDARPGATASRVLVYHYHRPQFRDLRPIAAPEGVTVVETGDSAEGTRRFRVTCRLPERSGRKDQRVVFQVGRAGETIEVPISMVVRSQ